MKCSQSFSLLALFVCVLGGNISSVFAVELTKPKLSATEIWKQIVSGRAALDQAMVIDVGTLSIENREAARKRAADLASKLEETANDFWFEFPNDTNLLSAVAHCAYALGIEAALAHQGLFSKAIDRITGIEFESELTKDTPSLSRHAKAIREVCESNLVAGVIAALHFQPTNNLGILFHLAQKAKNEAGKSLVRELFTNSLVPSVWTESASNILNRRFSIGQPFSIKFTGFDGRKVDSQKMRGKVLLVNFWGSYCPSCVTEIPKLKSLHKKYRSRGFEIVGVNLDREIKSALKVIKGKEITWPNMMDAGGLENGFAGKCGIFWIPNNWLVDKKGNLREIAADADDLEKKIKLLLAEAP